MSVVKRGFNSTLHYSSFFHTALLCAAQHKHSTCRQPPTAFLQASADPLHLFPFRLCGCNEWLWRHSDHLPHNTCFSAFLLSGDGVVNFNPELLITPKCLYLRPFLLTPLLLTVPPVLFCDLGHQEECSLPLQGPFFTFRKVFAGVFPNTSNPSSPPTLSVPQAQQQA